MSINDYGAMIRDRVRMTAYSQALRQAIRPDSVVLDIGAGAGIFALLACRFGARRVYAVEPNNAIHVAKEMAAANGYADRMVFIQDLSTEVTLPERADVIISDLRGMLPLFERHLPAVIDARQRHLAPGGRLIPEQDVLWAALVEAPEHYSQYTSPWDDGGFELDMRAARRMVLNNLYNFRAPPEHFLAEPQPWATLDYTALSTPDARGDLNWIVARAGTAHGLSLWFEATLGDGLGFSTSPALPELIYGNAFLPLLEPVAVNSGDRVAVTIKANLVGDDYTWRWDTRVVDQGDPGQRKVEFRQSTFFGLPLSPAKLRKRGVDYIPALDRPGRIDQFILMLMDGQIPLSQIARRVVDQFPEHFKHGQDALNRVRRLSEKYSR